MFLDIAIGIFVSIWASGIFNIPTSFHVVFWAIVMALIMDSDLLVDQLFFILRGRKLSKHSHRDVFHYPALYVLIGIAILSLFANSLWVFIFVFVSLFHFLHDSIGIGWGVYWLYPFSRQRYSFFYHYDVFRHKLKPYKWVYSWNDQEVGEMRAHYGDPNWIKNIYFKFHPYALAELAIFFIALFVLFRTWF